MFVHPDEAGNDGVVRQVDDFVIGGNGRLCVANGLDKAIADDDSLVGARWRAGPIDDADVGKGNAFCGEAEEPGPGGLSGEERYKSQRKQVASHGFHWITTE